MHEQSTMDIQTWILIPAIPAEYIGHTEFLIWGKLFFFFLMFKHKNAEVKYKIEDLYS